MSELNPSLLCVCIYCFGSNERLIIDYNIGNKLIEKKEIFVKSCFKLLEKLYYNLKQHEKNRF